MALQLFSCSPAKKSQIFWKSGRKRPAVDGIWPELGSLTDRLRPKMASLAAANSASLCSIAQIRDSVPRSRMPWNYHQTLSSTAPGPVWTPISTNGVTSWPRHLFTDRGRIDRRCRVITIASSCIHEAPTHFLTSKTEGVPALSCSAALRRTMPVPPIAVRSSTVTFSGEATRGKKVVVAIHLPEAHQQSGRTVL